MIRRPPRSTRTDTLFPYTALFRSLLAFARLNPGDGLWNMYNKLDATYRSNDPQLIDVAYPQVDVIQAYYDHDRRRLAIALAPASEPTGPTGFSVNNLNNGQVYRVTVDGKRSDERREGKGCVRTWKSRWSAE